MTSSWGGDFFLPTLPAAFVELLLKKQMELASFQSFVT